MSELTSPAGDRIVTISGRDAHQLGLNVVLKLRSLLREGGTRHDVPEPESVVPFQAEGDSMPDLIRRLFDDVMAAIVDSPTVVVDVELANILKTDQGLRAWGYVRFGSRPRSHTLPDIYVEPEPTATDAGDAEIRLIVSQAPPSVPVVPFGAGDGASR